MHEFGHHPGLLHGGADCFNDKPNYMRRINEHIIRPAWLPIILAMLMSSSSAAYGQALPELSIADVTIPENTCGSQVATFTVAVSPPFGKDASVHYATDDRTAVAGRDYTAARGTLSFPRGSKASQTITVPIADVLIPGPNKKFVVTLSNPVNAELRNNLATGTIVSPAVAKCQSCGVSCDDGDACTQDSCSATLGCLHVNGSATGKPYCELAGQDFYGGAGPDPNFAQCGPSGRAEWVDSDQDGLSDAEEKQGYIDLNANGVYDDGVDVPLNVDGASDPNRPDIYLHYDYSFNDGTCAASGVAPYVHSHKPPDAALAMIKAAFASHGANLHIDPRHHAIPECGPEGAMVVTNLTSGPSGGWFIDPACGGDASTGGVTSMHALKQIHLGAGALLSPAFHYMVFSHYSTCPDQAHCNACTTSSESTCGAGRLLAGSLGDAEVFGEDAIVSFGANTDHPQPGEPSVGLETWAAVTMHELGHNLGLMHGGAADCTNQKPNYLSVMNYSFYGGGLIEAAYPSATTFKTCTTDADCGGEPYHCSEQTDPSNSLGCTNPSDPRTCPHWCYHVDYSDKLLTTLGPNGVPTAGLDQNHLNETVGLLGAPDSRDLTFYYWNRGLRGGYASTTGTPIDWSGDRRYQTDVCEDVSDNEPAAACGTLPILQPSNDWLSHISGGATVFDNLRLQYQCSNSYAAGAK